MFTITRNGLDAITKELGVISNNIANSSILLTCFSFPIACNLSANIFLKKGSDLNQTLTKTARFLFIYTLLFSVGLII